MSTLQILLIVLGLLLVIGLMWRRHTKMVAVPTSNNSLGVQLRKGAENIPVYGTFVKVAGVVGKPLNNALDKFTGYQADALKHIPVVGGVLAKPLDYSRSVAKKVNDWIGL